MTDNEIIERLAQGEDSRTQFKRGLGMTADAAISIADSLRDLGVCECGNRPSAASLRALAENAIENESKHVTLDFDGAPICSTVFIDELVGKLLVRYGFLDFTQKVSLVNLRGLSAQLVNHSVVQRMAALQNGGGGQ